MPNICMKAAVNTEGNGMGHDATNPLGETLRHSNLALTAFSIFSMPPVN